MYKITAIPLKEVNGVKFGMNRAEVRQILGEAKEFKKSKYSVNTTDDFGFCHVFYDENDKCEAIEIFDAEVVVDNILVFPSNIENAKKMFKDLEKKDDSYISVKSSVGIYAPNNNVESILFGAEGYY